MKQLRHDLVPYADPLHAGRHPFQTFMVGLCVVVGVPLLDGSAGAGSVSALLPGWMAFGWGLSLCLGSIVALVGSYWPRASYATALTLERAGLCVVGPAALVYAAIIPLYARSWDGSLVVTLIVFGFGASCLRRARDIGKVITRAIATNTAGDHPAPVLREGETPGQGILRDEGNES